MFISDFAIRKPIVTIVTMLTLVVFGLFALTHLEVDEYPEIAAPVVTVSVPYPGASPDVVEREVIERIEEAVSGISGLDRMQSTAADGYGQLIVFFVFEKGVEQAAQDVRDQIATIRGELPPEIEEPVIARYDFTDDPIVSLTLTSATLTQAQLTAIAEQGIARDLRAVAGVASVSVVGGVERELSVEVRPADLMAAGIGISEVVSAIRAQNLAAPVGRVDGRVTERTIRLQGRPGTPEQFERLVIAQRNGRQVRLGEVATVRDGAEEPRSSALFNGTPAVGIDIRRTRGYSTTAVADRVKQRITALQQSLPQNAELAIVRDAGERVANSVRNVEETLVVGAILTVLVVFLFLNSWRSTVITGLALPVSVLASFVAIWIAGFTLNTMSLLGLSLAIGILIDDAIVVRENIVHHIEKGEDHYAASMRGTDEIGLAVTATTFSIVAVFVPVAFMYGIAGQWFKPFALTIACAVLVSLFVSFSLDPMLSAYWADPHDRDGEATNPMARALDRFNRWFDRQADRYRSVIAWALDHRTAVALIAAASLAGALFLQMRWGGFGFVPVGDDSEITIAIETPPGSNLAYTQSKAEQVAALVRSHPEVAYTYTSIGATGFASGGSVDQATIYARLVRKAKRELSQEQLGAILRDEVRRVGGAKSYVYAAGFGGPFKQLMIEVRGPDARVLTDYAERIATAIERVPGAVDVGLSTRGQKPELNIELDRGVAGALGITTAEVAMALRSAFAGIDAGDWVDPTGENRDVVVRLAPEARRRVEQLRQLPIVVSHAGSPTPSAGADAFRVSQDISNGAGMPANVIPLEQIATVTAGIGPAQIDHLDRERVVTVGANVQGRSVGEVAKAVDAAIAQLSSPGPQYRITHGGEVKDQREVFGRIFAALAFAVLLMYLILVVQFGSFLEPIAIMLSLPLSLIGVVLALLLTGDTLNIMSMIGVILLMGIVAKNAILLVDFAKWGRRQGLSRRDAIIEAGRVRLRPIMMTTFALIAGMIPVSLGLGEGADFRAPLGRAVIGGVLTATLLTLVVIPTVYEALDQAKAWVVARWKQRVALESEPVIAPVVERAD